VTGRDKRAHCLHLVIASAAKQSRIPPRKDSGFLRCARNDGARGGIAILQWTFQAADTPSHPRGTMRPSFAWSLHPQIQEGAGKTGCRLAPAVHCAKGCAKETAQQHTGEALTRPSLRSGWTAYAVLSREPSSLWPPSLQRKSPTPRRLTRLPHPQELDRSNDGQDHTVLPYARPAISPQFSRPCRRSRKLTDETNLTAPLVGTKFWAHGEQSALPSPLVPDAAASTASPARENDDHMIALKDEPGWTTHTTKPNFGKVEYFERRVLTASQVFCPSGNTSHTASPVIPRREASGAKHRRGASKDARPRCGRAVARRGPPKRRPPQGDGDVAALAMTKGGVSFRITPPLFIN
jgi:hypothetical protein